MTSAQDVVRSAAVTKLLFILSLSKSSRKFGERENTRVALEGGREEREEKKKKESRRRERSGAEQRRRERETETETEREGERERDTERESRRGLLWRADL